VSRRLRSDLTRVSVPEIILADPDNAVVAVVDLNVLAVLRQVELEDA
jgi:hypothetical protein